ncbi:MAG: hypothetical protein ACEQSL_03185 [Sediminibacterium sp.]
MYYTLPKITASIAMLVCLAHFNVAAQESIPSKQSELTFEIQVNEEQNKLYAEICEDALMRYDNLDEYRFVHSDRIISFQKLNITVILFSAKKLNLTSGRFIQDACINHGEIYSEVEFRLFLQDGQYCIAPIFINEKELICP